MKKNILFQLYMILRVAKSNSLTKESKVKLIMLRSKLRDIALERDKLIEEARENESEETIQHAVAVWANEDASIDMHILSEDEIISVLSENDFAGYDEDILYNNLKTD